LSESGNSADVESKEVEPAVKNGKEEKVFSRSSIFKDEIWYKFRRTRIYRKNKFI
jgi:hypothetical protein